jgi:hypothetical protein
MDRRRFIQSVAIEASGLAVFAEFVAYNSEFVSLKYQAASGRKLSDHQTGPCRFSPLRFCSSLSRCAHIAFGSPGMRPCAAGAYPNAGRNTVLMPGINDLDLSFAKKFKVTEEKTIVFRADFANAFNHPQYTAGYVSSVRLTSQTNSRVFLYPSSVLFLQWDQNFPSNPRNIQPALRFTF